MARQAKKYPRRMLVGSLHPAYQYPWKEGDYVLLLGEIVDMRGHYVIVTEDGMTHFGYHGDNLLELPKD